jgi:signal transduction histidine kinase
MASVNLYEKMAQAKKLLMQVNIVDDYQVFGDAGKITLALNNLLDNAIKFTNEGNITIKW